MEAPRDLRHNGVTPADRGEGGATISAWLTRVPLQGGLPKSHSGQFSAWELCSANWGGRRHWSCSRCGLSVSSCFRASHPTADCLSRLTLRCSTSCSPSLYSREMYGSHRRRAFARRPLASTERGASNSAASDDFSPVVHSGAAAIARIARSIPRFQGTKSWQFRRCGNSGNSGNSSH